MTDTPRAMVLAGGLAAGFCLLAAPAAHASAACSAAAIEGLGVAGVTVTSATAKPAAGTTPAYCDVLGQLATTGDDTPAGSAGFELQLPSNWNTKFLFFGVGGLAGAGYADFSANPVDQQFALAKGYATAITDTGHLAGGTDGSWALTSPGHPDEAKLTDYYYRATHEVTIAGKQLTQSFYGGGPISEAYFDGCSNGGRQAMIEASYYYDDYDGVIAGDPFFDIRTIVNGVKNAKQLLTPETYIPASLLPAVDAAVNASCDAVDGVADGLIQNPAACGFNPYSMICQPGQTADCLSEGQAATLDTYFSATRTKTGRLVYPGYTVSNLATSATGALSGGGADLWTTGFVPPTSFTAREPWGNGGFSPSPVGYQFADHITQDFVYEDPNADTRSFPVSADGFVTHDGLVLFDARTSAGDASDPSAYGGLALSGHKLIIYHGLSDPALTPFRTINLYKQLARRAGGYSKIQQDARLFLVPGMQHCIGGPGPNVFDTLTALENWVEKGQAPQAIQAAHYVNDDPTKAVDRTMPLCAFPTEATYAGTGDVNSAANWSCKPNRRLLQVGPNGAEAGAGGE